MKILITGPLKDSSGYAHFARNLALALHKSGVDTALRHIKYDNFDYKCTPLESNMFNKSIRDCDIVIQCTTPNEIRYIPGKMNISFLFWETTAIPKYWVDQLNLMDMIIVPCRFNSVVLRNCGVKKPIAICHPPFNLDLYKRDYKPLDIPEFKNKKIYYNICQLSSKKGIDVLLKAYFRAFFDIPNEVLLVLKVFLGMIDRSNDEAIVLDMINRIKQNLRLPVDKYPGIYLITDLIDDELIYRLHKSADVYVCSSRGEGWGIPPFEALAMGNILISHNWGGLADFVTPHNSVMYQANQSIVFNNPHPDPFLYTGLEDWAEPNDHQLMVSLRSVHETLMGRGDNLEKRKEHLTNIVSRAKEDVKTFDVSFVGPFIKNSLQECYESWSKNGYVVLKEQVNEVKKV